MAKPELTFDAVRVFTSNPAKIKKASNLARDKIMDRILEKSKGIKNSIKTAIKTEQSQGRQYYSRRTKRFRFASAPFFPPNKDTGHLMQGVALKASKLKTDPSIEFSVTPKGEKTDYAPYLEFGTENKDGSIKMYPRPFFFFTIEQEIEKPKFQKAIKQVQYAIKNDLQGMLLERRGK